MACAGLDGLAMAGDAGIDEQRLGLGCRHHAVDVFVEERVVEFELLLVFGGERGVGFDDGDELDLGMLAESAEEAADVAVFEADDGDADGCRVTGLVTRGPTQEQ